MVTLYLGFKIDLKWHFNTLNSWKYTYDFLYQSLNFDKEYSFEIKLLYILLTNI